MINKHVEGKTQRGEKNTKKNKLTKIIREDKWKEEKVTTNGKRIKT